MADAQPTAVVFVIYATGSNTIRRVIVSGELSAEQITKSCAAGESSLEVPFDSYGIFNDDKLRAYVADQIGAPLNDGRCIEVDSRGVVVAAYSADPQIDKPVLHNDNTIELHRTADIGDMKVDGVFPDKPPAPVAPNAPLPPVASLQDKADPA